MSLTTGLARCLKIGHQKSGEPIEGFLKVRGGYKIVNEERRSPWAIKQSRGSCLPVNKARLPGLVQIIPVFSYSGISP